MTSRNHQIVRRDGGVRLLLLLLFWILCVSNDWTGAGALALALFLGTLLSPSIRFQFGGRGGGTVSLVQSTDRETRQKLLELVADGAYDGIWEWDVLTKKVFWSDQVNKLFGFSRGELGDDFQALRSMMHSDDRKQFDELLRSHFVHNSSFQIELRIKVADWDDYRYYRIQGKSQLGPDNEPSRMMGSISDITEQKLTHQQLEHNAYNDVLTSLGNRNAMMGSLNNALNNCLDREDAVFALVLLDIDKFKVINDSYGQDFADVLLKDFAVRLRNLVRPGDGVFRIGGDEFIVLINRLRQRGDATLLYDALRRSLEQAFVVNQCEVFLSVSSGIVFVKDGAKKAEEVLQEASLALYHAKQQGPMRMEIFREVFREIRRNYMLERDLRHALAKEELYLVYQPICDLKTERVVGFEALIRWRHERSRDISPVEFIPIAESSGLILPIGEWVMRQACREFSGWIERGFALDFISINVSAPQVLQQDVPHMVERICRETRLDPTKVKLEFTESAAMKDVRRVIETIDRLHRIGVRVSLDDFGTGYSSLGYLKQFKIHTLKIDRSFVIDILDKPSAHTPHDAKGTIAETIIGMARTLGLDIIAEGVEFPEQADFLRQRGVQYAQGFLYGKPLVVPDAEAILAEQYSQKVSILSTANSEA